MAEKNLDPYWVKTIDLHAMAQALADRAVENVAEIVAREMDLEDLDRLGALYPVMVPPALYDKLEAHIDHLDSESERCAEGSGLLLDFLAEN